MYFECYVNVWCFIPVVPSTRITIKLLHGIKFFFVSQEWLYTYGTRIRLFIAIFPQYQALLELYGMCIIKLVSVFFWPIEETIYISINFLANCSWGENYFHFFVTLKVSTHSDFVHFSLLRSSLVVSIHIPFL